MELPGNQKGKLIFRNIDLFLHQVQELNELQI